MIDWQWKPGTGVSLSDEARGVLGASCLLLLVVGVLSAVAILGASECARSRRAGRWFLIGRLTLPLLFVLLLSLS